MMLCKFCVHWSKRAFFWRSSVIRGASSRTQAVIEMQFRKAPKEWSSDDKQALPSGDEVFANASSEKTVLKAKEALIQSWTDRRTIPLGQLICCLYLVSRSRDTELPLAVWMFIAELLQPLVDSTSAYDAAKILRCVSLITAHHLKGETGCAPDQFRKIISDIKNRFRGKPDQVRELPLDGLIKLINSFGEGFGEANMDVFLAQVIGPLKAQIQQYPPKVALRIFSHCSIWLPRNVHLEMAVMIEERLATVLPELTICEWGLAAECFLRAKHRTSKMNITAYLLENYHKCQFLTQVRLFVYCAQVEAKFSNEQACWCIDNLKQAYAAFFKGCSVGLLLAFARALRLYRFAVPGVHVAELLAAFCDENLDWFFPTKHAHLAFYLCEVLSFDQCVKFLDYAMSNCETGDTLLDCLYALGPHKENKRAMAVVAKLAADGFRLAAPTKLTLSKAVVVCHTLNRWRLSYRHWLTVVGDFIIDNVSIWFRQDDELKGLVSVVHTMALLVFLDQTFWEKLIYQFDRHANQDVLLRNPNNLVKLVWSCVVCGRVWVRGRNLMFGWIHAFVNKLELQERVFVLQIANWSSLAIAYRISEALYAALFEGMRTRVNYHPDLHDSIANELESMYGPGKWLKDIITAEGCLVPFAGLWHWTGRFLSWNELYQDPFTTWHPPQQGRPSSERALDPARRKESIIRILKTRQLITSDLTPVALFLVVGRSHLLNEMVLYGRIRANMLLLRNLGWVVQIMYIRKKRDEEDLRCRTRNAVMHVMYQLQK